MTVWTSDEEHVDIYPGVTVWDDRVSGSMTDGRSRLPLWAFSYSAIVEGWDAVSHDYEPTMSAEELARFVTALLEQRGCFARLLAQLAEVERRSLSHHKPWWKVRRSRRMIERTLRECLAAIELPGSDES